MYSGVSQWEHIEPLPIAHHAHSNSDLYYFEAGPMLLIRARDTHISLQPVKAFTAHRKWGSEFLFPLHVIPIRHHTYLDYSLH